MDITTVERVKAAGSQTTTVNDARITQVIQGVSAYAETVMGRHLQVVRRMDEVYRVERGMPLVWLRGMPIVTVHKVYYATRRRFDGLEELSTDDFDVHDVEGQIELRIQATGDPGWLMVDYEGGMAIDTTSFATLYPEIVEAATLECVNRINRQATPEGEIHALDTGTKHVDEVKPLKVFVEVLAQRRRLET